MLSSLEKAEHSIYDQLRDGVKGLKGLFSSFILMNIYVPFFSLRSLKYSRPKSLVLCDLFAYFTKYF